MSKRLAFGVIDAAAISRDNLLLALGGSMGFVSRIKAHAEAGAMYSQISSECDEHLEWLLLLCGLPSPDERIDPSDPRLPFDPTAENEAGYRARTGKKPGECQHLHQTFGHLACMDCGEKLKP